MIVKLEGKDLFRIITMNTKQLYPALIILLLVIGCEQVDISRDKALSTEGPTAEFELSRELKIYKNTLLESRSEQIRIDAASVLLFSQEQMAREILLEVLKQTENIAARVAVCKALSQARALEGSIEQKGDFIQPLFDILNTETDDSAKSAAEAILIFDYEQISEPLEEMVTNSSLPVSARLNAIYALRLQPDMRAIFKLIDRLDDHDSQVAAEAEKALRSIGTPIGKDAEARKQIRTELRRKGRDEFFRDLLIRQEAKMRDLQAERDLWKERYLAVSGRMYSGISEDAVRSKFLTDYLGNSEAVIRLWALEKVSQWRKGTKPKLPSELEPILIKLISDRDRDVRLKTARLLSLMGELNSAQPLMEQLEIEEDDEVKLELFVALGGACHYAFSPDSKIKISSDIRKKALEWSKKYLAEQDPKKAQKGAEVIKKLLEHDGLKTAEVDEYLDLFIEKYNQQKNNADRTLRGELLGEMAGLCVRSVYKAEATRLFGPLFEAALYDEADMVREAAVDGISYIDKAKALRILRKDFVNDNSVIVRKKIIDLAGEVGGREDLLWLSEKIESTAEGELAWQVMLRIFTRSDIVVLEEWISGLDVQKNQAKLSDEQRISFLEIAERKAIGENKPQMRKDIRKKLAKLYSQTGEFEQAAEYLGLLYQVAQTPEEKEVILADLLDVYLDWPSIQDAVNLIANRLSITDLGVNDFTVRSIENYLSKPSDGTDSAVLLAELAKITVGSRPKWAKQIKNWTKRLDLSKPKGAEELKASQMAKPD